MPRHKRKLEKLKRRGNVTENVETEKALWLSLASCCNCVSVEQFKKILWSGWIQPKGGEVIYYGTSDDHKTDP